MYLIYLDESGNSGTNMNDPNQPIHYVGALIIHSSQWLAIEAEVEAIIDGLGITGVARDSFEFHATDLYQGTGFFRGWPLEVRFGVMTQLLTIVQTHNLPIIYAGIRKPELCAKYVQPANPHDLAFLMCAERVERWFCNRARDETGMYIADETRAKASMKRSLRSYRRVGIQLGRPTRLDHVIDTIHFADSRESFGIQLADACVYTIKRLVEEKRHAEQFAEIIRGQRYAGRLFP